MNRKRIILLIIIMLFTACIALIIVAILAAQKVKAPEASNVLSYPESFVEDKYTPTIGVTFSPKTTESSDFLQFFTKATEASNVIGWYGDILQLNDLRQAPYSITDISKQNKLDTLAIVNYYSQGEKAVLRPLQENKDKYLAGMAQYVSKYNPKYFGIGIEVNWMYRDNPDLFNEFVGFFNEAAEKLKVISPNTKIFTVFQLEQMKGLQGGLYAKTNNEPVQWDLINRFPKADVIAFTSYPGLIYKTPGDIPTDYYTSISQNVLKPVIFTEIGWSRTTVASGWISSPERQAEFINRFFNLTKDIKPDVVIWSFLYDPPSFNLAFNTMGLLNDNDETSPGLTAWKNHLQK